MDQTKPLSARMIKTLIQKAVNYLISNINEKGDKGSQNFLKLGMQKK